MIGFAAYKNHLNEQRYAVRGIGVELDEFNAWSHDKIVVTEVDWPWMSFKFLDVVDEAEFIAKYNTDGYAFDVGNN